MNLKGLLKDTAIYGLSSIVGRFLNYMLTPLYTRAISAESGGYGVVTEVYAYTALILVMLTFGMETTFFRYANDERENPHTVFSTTFALVTTLSLCFIAAVWGFIGPIGEWMGYPDHHEYILMMAICVAIDAIQAIPFCLLRFQKRPIKFATIKLAFIFLNVGLNLLYFCVLKYTDVFYIFAINLVCTAVFTFAFIPEFFKTQWHIDLGLLRRMFGYSWPILVLGLAGILNQTADKMIFKHLYGDMEAGKVQLGIYGACVKIAMIMAMITQAFRYAYEPFVFAGSKDKDQKVMYSEAMKYFILFTLLAFLMVMGYMDLLKEFLIKDEGYWEGLKVVPIVMMAEIMMGISFNLSIWYKLTDKTIWGAIISIVGCIVLLAVNIIFVPQYSYMACAWGAVAGYGICMVMSYFLGQKYFPINYQLKTVFLYVILAVAGYYAIEFINDNFTLLPKLALNTVVIGIFAGSCVLQLKRK